MKYLSIVLSAIMLLVLACVEYEETITLNEDGSGTITIHYILSEAFTDEDTPFTTDKEEIEKEVASDKVKVESVDVYTEEGKTHIVTELSFKDINDLPRKWVFKDREISFKKEAGFLIFHSVLKPEKEQGSEEESKEIDDLGESFVEAMLAEYSFSFTVEMPSQIVEAIPEGTIEKNRVVWSFPLSSIVEKDFIEMTAKAAIPVVKPSSVYVWIIVIVAALIVAVIVVNVISKKRLKE